MSKMKERWAELEQAAKDAGEEVWEFGSFANGEIRIGASGEVKHGYFCTMVDCGSIPWDSTESSKDAFNKAAYIAAANPAAIMELLEVTKGLAEALNDAVVLAEFAECWITDPAIEGMRRLKGKADKYRAAIAKYEGVQSE